MPPAEQDPAYVAVVIATLGFMIGFAKGGFGGLGASLAPPARAGVLTPILALVLPVALAVGVLLPLSLANWEATHCSAV